MQEIHDVQERSRYEITVDGDLAGFAVYRIGPDRITFVHTEIDDAFAGQGIGGALVRGALDDVRTRGLRVVAECPFVKAWIERHPDYADLTRAG